LAEWQANTIVGAGMLSFPASYASSGYLLGSALLLVRKRDASQ
jgi:amino acid permease